MEEIKSFVKKVNTACVEADHDISLPDLRNTISKELNFNEVYAKLIASKQDKIQVREIIMESEIDFINSAKHLKAVFDLQLDSAIEKVNELYEREMLNLKSLYRKEFFGASLMDLIKVLNNNKYSLIIMNSRIYAYRYYDPPFEVIRGQFESGITYEYEEPVCCLKGVYINLLHPKITNGTVLITCESRHPNSKNSGLSEACVGDMDGQDIPINDPESLVKILDEICEMYETMHLDSAYFMPEGSFKQKEGKKWTAA